MKTVQPQEERWVSVYNISKKYIEPVSPNKFTTEFFSSLPCKTSEGSMMHKMVPVEALPPHPQSERGRAPTRSDQPDVVVTNQR